MKNQRLKNSILEVVDNQLAANDPPFVRDIFEHLALLTGSDREAKEMIGGVMAAEIYDIMSAGEMFDESKYHEKLNVLFDRFDPEDVEITSAIAGHPFCRMQREYDDAKWGDDDKGAASAFLRHWNNGLRDWLKEIVTDGNGQKKPFIEETFEDEDDIVSGTEVLYFFQDIDMDLLNEGFYEERIAFSKDMLEMFSWDGHHSEWSGFYQQIGESLNRMGDYAECDRHFEEWIAKEPDNIRAVNMYLNCLLSRKNDAASLQRAEELIRKYLSEDTEITEDNSILIYRAKELYDALGKDELKVLYSSLERNHKLVDTYDLRPEGYAAHRAYEQNAMETLVRELEAHTPFVAPQKTRPNDPCPCGSGKKYKKCCGRSV